MEQRALLSAVSWTGAVSNDWDTARNWSDDAVPGANDDVTIDTADTVVHSDDVTDTINSLTTTGPLSITGGTLAITGGTAANPVSSTIGGTLSVSNLGTLSTNGAVSVSGLTTIEWAAFSGSGTVNLDGGASIDNVDPGASIDLVRGLLLEGPTLNIPSGQVFTWVHGTIQLYDGSVLNNYGTINVSQYGGNFTAGDTIPSTAVINDMGTINVNATVYGLSDDDVPFNGNGDTINVASTCDLEFYFVSTADTVNLNGSAVNIANNGEAVFAAAGSATGTTFTTGAGSTLSFYQSPFTFGAETSISGTGTLATYANLVFPTSLNLANFTGPTNVFGTLQVDGSLPASALTIYGTLSGTGTVGAITVYGAVSPGDGGAPGILTAEGNVSFALIPGGNVLDARSFFTPALNGPDAGTGFSQLNVNGTVNLSSCDLDTSLGFTPTTGESIPIIESTAPIVGTFAGLPQGASLLGGVPCTISYTGGASGDDLVLTQAATTTTPPTGTTTSLGSSANPSTLGQTVTFTAIVAPTSGTSTPIGNVTFTIDGQTQTPVALGVINGVDEATLTTTTLTLGSNTIGAAYSGNSAFSSSEVPNPLTQTINAQTATMLGSSANPSTVGQAVTFSATVTGPNAAGTPTGSVNFDEGNTVLMTSALDASGKATFTTSALAVGSNSITAVYTPTGYFLGSPSTALTQVVSATPLEATATRVTSSNGASSVGQAVTFTAFVTTTGTGTPGGTVTFTIDGQPQPPVTLAVESGSDEASFTTRALTAGSYTFGAIYNGDPSFATSQAAPQAQSVSASVTTPPPSTDGPRITLVQRYGYHMGQTSIVLTFDQALDAVTAEDAADYRITGPAGQTIAVRKAVYDPADLTVTLHPVDRVNVHKTYKLIVDGTSPHGLTNTSGQLLDGADRGSPDSNYDGLLTWRNLVLDPLPKGWHASKT